MGCNFSAHPRTSPHRPRFKPGKIADIHLPESPKSTSKTTLESPPYLSKPRLTFGPSNSFQVTSPTTTGTIDILKVDQSVGELTSPPIIIKGLVQVTMGSHNDSKEKSDSQSGTPGPDGSLKKDFTFFGQLQSAGSSYEMNPRQTDRFLGSHRPSAFFGEKRMSSSSVLKLSTFAGSQSGVLPDELLETNKKTITSKSLAASLLAIEQESHPDTPGFKSSPPPKYHNQLTLDVIRSRGSSRQSDDGQEEEQKGPFKVFSKTIQIVPQEQENLQSPPSITHVKSWPCAPEEPSPNGKGTARDEKGRNLKVKSKLQRKFTQNLLDLVPVKRNDLSHKKKTLETPVSPPLVVKKLSSEMDNEESLSLGSAAPPVVEHHRNIFDTSDKSLVRNGSRKLKTIKLRDLEFLNNGEMISPINNMPRQRSPDAMSSPFSYQASFSKHVLEGSEFMDDKTMTNAENISRVDFDKYSFVAEVKEIEVDNNNSIIDTNFAPYKPIKKSIFNERRAEVRENSPSIVLPEEEEEEVKEIERVVPKLHKSSSLMVESPNPKRLLKNKTFHDISSAEQDSSINKNCKSSPFLLSEPSLMKRKSKAKSIQVVETMILDKSFDENGFKKINDYTLQHELGRGSFAKVKLGFDYRDGVKVEYAIKIVSRKKIKKKMFTKQKNAFTQLQAEIAIMKKMSHPNIVQLFEVIDAPDEDKMYLIMEYAVKGAVMSKHFWSFEPAEEEAELETSGFKKVRPLNETKAKQYFRDLILGMHYMHHFVNAIHRDIKPENLLVDENDALKIADFNISQMFEKNSQDVVQDDLGTRLYLAPEAWLGASFRGKPADIWAAGATLYYFLYGKPPFPEKFGKSVRDMILQGEPEFPEEKGINPKAIDLIKQCLIKDPDKRITVEMMMEDEWITDDGENPLSNYEYEPMGVATEEEMKKAVTIKPQTILLITNQLVKSLTSARRNLQILKTEGSPDGSPLLIEDDEEKDEK